LLQSRFLMVHAGPRCGETRRPAPGRSLLYLALQCFVKILFFTNTISMSPALPFQVAPSFFIPCASESLVCVGLPRILMTSSFSMLFVSLSKFSLVTLALLPPPQAVSMRHRAKLRHTDASKRLQAVADIVDPPPVEKCSRWKITAAGGFPLLGGFGEGCLLHDLGRGRLSDSPARPNSPSGEESRGARLVQTAPHGEFG